MLNPSVKGFRTRCTETVVFSHLSFVFLILVKPLSPQIYGLDGTLAGGLLYTLRCVAGHANPAAEISWYKDSTSWSASRVDISSFIGYYV